MTETTITHVIETNQSLVGWDTLITTLIAVLVSLLAVYVAYRLQKRHEKSKDKKRRDKLLESIKNDLYLVLQVPVFMLANEVSIEIGAYSFTYAYSFVAPVLSGCVINAPHYLGNDLPHLSGIYRRLEYLKTSYGAYTDTISNPQPRALDQPRRVILDKQSKHFILDAKILVQTCKINLEKIGLSMSSGEMNEYLSEMDRKLSAEELKILKELWSTKNG